MALDETSNRQNRRVRPFCFVIMSFNNRMSGVSNAIKAAVNSLGIDCFRVDDNHFTGPIADCIIDRMRSAYFIIADISDPRPNVFYEVGYAQGLGRPLILLAQLKVKPPFDVQHFNLLRYESVADVRSRLQQAIIDVVLTDHALFGNRRGKFGGLAVRNERLFCASVRPRSRYRKAPCRVVLEVCTLNPKRPLSGHAVFHLHKSFKKTKIEVKIKRGVARLVIEECYGRFVVGAVVDKGSTSLELDLSTVPGGNPKFYAS